MSDYTTPVGPLFELQRETIKRGVEVLQFPRELRNELTEEGIEAGKFFREQSLELSRQSVHQSITVAETLQVRDFGIERLRESVDSTFDAIDDRQTAAIDSLEEFYEESDRQFLVRMIEQVDFILQLNRRIETRVVELLSGIEQRIHGSTQIVTSIDQQFETLSEEIQRQIESYGELGPTIGTLTDIELPTPAIPAIGDTGVSIPVQGPDDQIGGDETGADTA